MTVTAVDDLDLDFVRSEQSNLWVSILLPSMRKAPDNRAGSTLLANLLRDAAAQLRQRRASEDLLAPAAALVDDSVFWQHQSEGLAIYLSEHGLHTFRIPRELSPAAVVGSVPRLRPLVPEMAREGRYHLLQLARKQVRLFDVTTRTITELDRGPIPASAEEYELSRDQQYTAPTPGGVMFGHGDSGEQDALREGFLREVARGVAERLGRRKPAVPLVVAATEKTAAEFRQLCEYPGMTDLVVPGSGDGMSASELLERTRPVLEAYQASEAQRRAERLHELRAGNRLVEQPHGVLGAAQEGRIDALLVGANDEELTDGVGPEDELVDRAIVATMSSGGRVLPMPAASTDTLIGVLRY